MGLFDWLTSGGRTDDAAAGNGNEARYLNRRQDGRGLAPGSVMVWCESCGESNGRACRCDPKLGRPRKWYE